VYEYHFSHITQRHVYCSRLQISSDHTCHHPSHDASILTRSAERPDDVNGSPTSHQDLDPYDESPVKKISYETLHLFHVRHNMHTASDMSSTKTKRPPRNKPLPRPELPLQKSPKGNTRSKKFPHGTYCSSQEVPETSSAAEEIFSLFLVGWEEEIM